MIPFEEALETVLSKVAPLRAEWVSSSAALGRFLARDLAADVEMPRFDNSSMDGYAIRLADAEGAREDRPARLALAGVIGAGQAWDGELQPGTALRIMTGAPMPQGAEAVVKREDAREENGEVLLFREAVPGSHIRQKGGEFRSGQILLRSGSLISPPVVALLAALGKASVEVHRVPRVRVLVTGSELKDPGEPLAAGQIYDSNGPGLVAAAKSLGLADVASLRCSDDPAALRAALAAAFADADAVLASGGVSVGDFDHVPSAFEALGGKKAFWKVAMKPGKPNYFGLWEREPGRSVPFFGLPGNPVGALLSFERLVRPALLRLMGGASHPSLSLGATLVAPVEKGTSRMEWVRGTLRIAGSGCEVEPISKRESHMLSGLAQADCVILFPAESECLTAGQRVEVQVLQWR